MIKNLKLDTFSCTEFMWKSWANNTLFLGVNYECVMNMSNSKNKQQYYWHIYFF